jgi:hypothetical protein
MLNAKATQLVELFLAIDGISHQTDLGYPIKKEPQETGSLITISPLTARDEGGKVVTKTSEPPH